MRKATAAFFLMILVMSLFTGISLFPQSKVGRIVAKKGEIVPSNEVAKSPNKVRG